MVQYGHDCVTSSGLRLHTVVTMKELWIDRDDAYMWFDVKPTYEALSHLNYISEHVAKVQVSDELYEAYQAHCEDVRRWQDTLGSLYIKEKGK